MITLPSLNLDPQFWANTLLAGTLHFPAYSLIPPTGIVKFSYFHLLDQYCSA